MPAPKASALDAALRLLAFRARSRTELTRALHQRKFSQGEVAEAFVKLTSLGYLDDARFANERALFLLRTGRLSGRAVLQRLKAHGVEELVSKSALCAAEQALGYSPENAARGLLLRRKELDPTLSPRQRARAARFLLSRGFDGELVERLLKQDGLSSAGQED